MDEKIIKEIIDEMVEKAGIDQSFSDTFFESIIQDDPLLNEFLGYLSTGKFTLENKVNGYSVVDVLVWQVDHFKAYLDRGLYGMRYNECEMLLKAFDTFIKMKKDPDKYLKMITEETGSDFEGKYQ